MQATLTNLSPLPRHHWCVVTFPSDCINPAWPAEGYVFTLLPARADDDPSAPDEIDNHEETDR